ncbi:cytochrome c-type biogenesis protein [Sulfuriflexus mobilis]|uniref:cytochrome c-type biogenesis protein n=1 Tax=Sulfuriflexus mobilis TaxID=1811807 RepID=UPI000F842E80|nr:cytochrome c-type biogenesis protein [Sulfuriflexus mobilis]
MRRILTTALLFVSLLLQAGVEVQHFDTPEQEARYKTLINELRCLVCQNQNLADSNAELAQDLRRQTYEMIIKGDADEEIVGYMVARYGDFVLYRPPFKRSTALLWAGPFILLFIGLTIVFLFIRRRNREDVPPLSEAQRQRTRRLLEAGDKDQ